MSKRIILIPSVVLLLLVCASPAQSAVAGQIVPNPSWSHRSENVPVDPSVASFKQRSLRSGKSRLRGRQGLSTWLKAQANDGVISVSELSSGIYGLQTHFTGIYHLSAFDLLSVSPSFGDESILVAGVLPSGAPGVSVIARNTTDSLRTATHHLLPLPSSKGEVFFRCGHIDGVVYVFEAASRSIIPFADSNSDLIPDQRLMPIFSYGSGEPHNIRCMRAPGPDSRLSPLPLMIFQEERSRPTIAALFDVAGTIIADYAVHAEVTNSVSPAGGWRFAWPPSVGHESVFLRAPNGSACAILVRRASESSFSTWVPSYSIGSTSVLGLSPRGSRPLETGDTLVVESGGVAVLARVVGSVRYPRFWDWGSAIDARQGLPLQIRGESLEQVDKVVFAWTRTDLASPSTTEHVRAHAFDAATRMLTVEGGDPFPGTGLVLIKIKKVGAPGWYAQRVLVP